MIGCLDVPDSGDYFLGGQNVARLSPDELAKVSREHVGFIFQRYHLMPDLSALDNVKIPAIYAGIRRDERRFLAASLLEKLGLKGREHHKPGELSGGQQQRVSIARALINGAEVILADEPTGALDSRSGQEVLAILNELNKRGHTVVIVTPSFSVRRISSAHRKHSAIVSEKSPFCGRKQHKNGKSTDTEQATYLFCGKHSVRAVDPKLGTITSGIKKPALHGRKVVQLGQTIYQPWLMTDRIRTPQ
jgi:ABC-type lipoprotein export system ATPase subunit